MSDPSSSHIESVRPEEEEAILPELIALLQDAVARPASIGFMPPLPEEDAHHYWRGVLQEVARDAGHIVGSVQLALATKPNALHRAEVQKLLVLQSQRRRGLGWALMQAVEQAAHESRRTLLVLDTRLGDVAEQLYLKLGYHRAGVIPAYVRNEAGTFESTVLFYKIVPPLS